MRSPMRWPLVLGLLLVLAGSLAWRSAPVQARHAATTHVATTQLAPEHTVLGVQAPEQPDFSFAGLAVYALLLGLLLTVVALIGLRICGKPTSHRSMQQRRL